MMMTFTNPKKHACQALQDLLTDLLESSIIHDQFFSPNNTNKEKENSPSAPSMYPIPKIKIDHV